MLLLTPFNSSFLSAFICVHLRFHLPDSWSLTPDPWYEFMTNAAESGLAWDRPSGFVERMLARLDRVPGLGGGRTHFLFLALFFGLSFSLYLTVLKARGPAAAISTHTPWDDVFPFAVGWLWVYMAPYVIGPLLSVVLSRATFAWYIRRGTLVMAVSLLIFALLPTHTKRPWPETLNGWKELGNGFTDQMYRNMVELDDPPSNAAPSLHVSLSCLLAWALTFDRPRWWAIAFLGASLIWLSTLLTWQHHLIDVVTGVFLASVAAIGPPRKMTR
jgi:membrane-associated phospholipid phosphatase